MTNTANNSVELNYKRERVFISVLGLVLAVLGSVALFLPALLLNSLAVSMGILLLIGGLAKAAQLVTLFWTKARWQRVLVALLQAALDFILAFLFLTKLPFSVAGLALILGLLFVLEGLLQLIAIWQTSSLRAKFILLIIGVLTMLAGCIVALNALVLDIKLIGWLAGAKLILFGLTLIFITLNSKQNGDPYRVIPPKQLPKIPGAVYAGYFGGAFHAGIYVGADQMVEFRDDDLVRKISWQGFLRGFRVPQLWEYPDVPKAPTDVIIKTALSKVGQEIAFKRFTYNCEHFVVECLSGGKTTQSRYTQNAAALQNIATHPLLGAFVEFYMRAIEWLIFKTGGVVGQRLSLRLRKNGALFTEWLLARTKSAKVKN